ncbi:MAG: biotin transporter BioY, partial [Clostridium sp.]|nr:biotin transporter BioY [Clostridium sp.]
GFIFMALIAGVIISHFPGHPLMHAVGMILGLAVCYTLGTAWLSVQLGISFTAALAVGVFPYLPGDAVKIAGAMFLGPKLRRGIRKAESRNGNK